MTITNPEGVVQVKVLSSHNVPYTLACLFGVAVLSFAADPAARTPRSGDALNFRSKGWRILGASFVKPTQGQLAIHTNLPKNAILEHDFDIDPIKDSHVTYEIFLPLQAKGVKHQLFFQDKDGLWFGTRVDRPLQPGRWHRVDVDISHDTGDLIPSGHRGGWDSYVASQANGIGIKFLSNVPYAGSIELSRFRVERGPVPHGKLKLLDFEENRRSVPLYGKHEVSFRLNQPFENPFDPEEVSIDAVFHTPTQKGVKHAGFYHQEYTRELKNDREVLTPFGLPCWKIRFTPTELGTHSYRILARCRDKSLITNPRTFECTSSSAGGVTSQSPLVTSPPGSTTDHSPLTTSLSGSSPETRNLTPDTPLPSPTTDTPPLRSGASSPLTTDHSPPGFVRVSKKDPRYFEFTNGDFFYPIGQNIHAPFDTRSVEFLKLPLRKNHGTFTYDYFFKKMSRHGENMVVMWMCSWWLALEWFDQWPGYVGLGRYNLQNAWRLDYLLEQCRKYGIYVHLVVDNHGKLSLRVDSEWDLNPYNADLGGPLTHPDQFFSDPRARDYYKRKMRYLIARWGYSPNLFGLELWGELNLTGSESGRLQVGQRAWHQEMGRYIKQIDPWNHLLTTHFSNDFRRVDAAIAALPEMDYVVCDAYKRGGSIVPLVQLTYEANSRYGKPCFVTEFGGDWNSGSHAQVKADLHAGLWSTFMTHSGGTPLIWWFDFVDKHDLYARYKAFSKYAVGEDRRNVDLLTTRPEVSVAVTQANRAIEAIALQNQDLAFVWIFEKNAMDILLGLQHPEEVRGSRVTLKGFREGDYDIQVWDTCTGEVVNESVCRSSEGGLAIELPRFRNDVALKVKRKGRK